MAGTEITGWYKSSYSGGETPQGECLEVAPGHPDIPIRDSKTPNSPALLLSPSSWAAFVTAVKDGNLTAASRS
ncbi:DUF397 domain-containing protein [Streptomyces lomondensis]|uniref:DUF397 domain-containing protein n=1 Tax=Streptomyces lomondensis TaxID=68229 RepID=A0ABQ2WVP2_9ACTN|nr:DUF397 domain-containing protein [Streptomyces lomondensis]MCF0078669.1 DUF397 domain-containing protein [Streptomyces lomondensis]GGW79189.1 hypothetical protein GCM10010383_03360 [Streptomyces lomondensis]